MNEALLAQIDQALLAWPGVQTEPGRFNSTAYKVGLWELGHIHRNGVADLPFPKAVREALIADGRARPHQVGVPGYVSFAITTSDDIGEAIALFRMNYERAIATTDDGDSSD
jgi:hypothetical protein